jgi:glycosyltransferase involved in cell wall biosynthesis
VADGFSNDGTVEYLKNLKFNNLIDKIILSEEKDLGEWHGYKKALEIASGEYIKFITDDDAFDYFAIEKCLQFLENNKNVDWLMSQGYSRQFNAMHYSGYHNIMKEKNSTNPEINGLQEGLCGLGFLIKRDITKNLDLLSNKYGARTDRQISLELTKSNYLGSTTNVLTWVRILNQKSNTLLYGGKLENSDIIQVNKNFKINDDSFKKELDECTAKLRDDNNKLNKEFLIF